MIDSHAGTTTLSSTAGGLVETGSGRITAGTIRYLGEDLAGAPDRRLERLRGKELATIFQDLMMTLNPVLRVDTQMVEAILAHEKVGARAARGRAAGFRSCPLRRSRR